MTRRGQGTGRGRAAGTRALEWWGGACLAGGSQWYPPHFEPETTLSLLPVDPCCPLGTLLLPGAHGWPCPGQQRQTGSTSSRNPGRCCPEDSKTCFWTMATLGPRGAIHLRPVFLASGKRVMGLERTDSKPSGAWGQGRATWPGPG